MICDKCCLHIQNKCPCGFNVRQEKFCECEGESKNIVCSNSNSFIRMNIEKEIDRLLAEKWSLKAVHDSMINALQNKLAEYNALEGF